jgi:hypothetical protein
VSEEERAEALITGRLLSAGARLGWLSLGLTLAAAAGLLAGRPGRPALLAMAALGLAGCFLAVRVGLDAGLFLDAADGRLSAPTLDAALQRLGLGRKAKQGRSWIERCLSARRLLLHLFVTIVLQCLLAAAAGWPT